MLNTSIESIYKIEDIGTYNYASWESDIKIKDGEIGNIFILKFNFEYILL
jgi:hypothetical protein